MRMLILSYTNRASMQLCLSGVVASRHQGNTGPDAHNPLSTTP
uniref:Uncharacterized protein n=1 Tax=Arundo donax TaxID=35708 RepID=A0A0A9GIF7_ARUDO